MKTARYCQLAAAQAEQRFAYREAARLWEQAIACLDQASDTPARDRLELVLRLVGALAQTGQLADARSGGATPSARRCRSMTRPCSRRSSPPLTCPSCFKDMNTALAIAEQANAEPWREAAKRRLRARSPE